MVLQILYIKTPARQKKTKLYEADWQVSTVCVFGFCNTITSPSSFFFLTFLPYMRV